MTTIPERGLSDEEIFARLQRFRAHDMPWREGRVWGYVFDPGERAEQVTKRAFMEFLSENALDPTVFPSARELERAVVSMAAAHLGGDGQVVGNFTSGGTESIVLAVKAARDHARARRGDLGAPRIVLPTTAHAAFHKAAHYLGLEKVLVPVDPRTFRADPDAMEAAIDERTILLVGSAVSYAHGVVDPIPELAEIARRHDLWLHVDACMGGFLLPYFRRLGDPIPDFDFRVDGVSSISMDLHKYAFAAKGASTVLYRDASLRRHQIFACAEWTGYTLANHTIQSSKSVGPIAAAYAVMHHMGDEGYLEIARSVREATRRLIAGIEEIEGLAVLGEPAMNLLAFTTGDTRVFQLADEMRARGWYVQPQLAFDSSPPNLHLSVNPASVRWVDDLLADLRVALEEAANAPSGGLLGRVRPLLASIEPESLTPADLEGMLAQVGVDPDALPERMAEVNEVMNALPPRLRGMLVTEFVNRLYR